MGEPDRRRLRDSAVGNLVVIVVAAAVVLAGVWLVGVWTKGDTPALSPSAAPGGVTTIEAVADAGPAPRVGEVAPDFTTFTTDGTDLTLASLQGKPVWLVFGATWCQNCRAETSDIEAVHRKYGERVGIVGVYVGESVSKTADYATRLKLTYPQVADASSDLQSSYRVMALPTHYFVGADGKVAAIKFGALTQQQASAELDKLLAR